MAKSFISSSVLPSDAKSRGAAFAITKTCRIVQVLQTSRLTPLSALGWMQLMPHSWRLPWMLLMVLYSLCLPDLVKEQCWSPIMRTPLMKHGLFFVINIWKWLICYIRAHIARWCTKSNRPMNIMKDHQFKQLMKTGCPGTSLPSPMMVACNVNILFDKSHSHIDKILKVHIMFYILQSFADTFAEASKSCSFCDRCMDLTKPSHICGMGSPSAPQWPGISFCAGHCWGSQCMLFPSPPKTTTDIMFSLPSHTQEKPLPRHFMTCWWSMHLPIRYIPDISVLKHIQNLYC